MSLQPDHVRGTADLTALQQALTSKERGAIDHAAGRGAFGARIRQPLADRIAQVLVPPLAMALVSWLVYREFTLPHGRPLGAAAVAFLLLAITVWWFARTFDWQQKWQRLAQLAQTNGWAFAFEAPIPDSPAAHFRSVGQLTSMQRLTMNDRLLHEVGMLRQRVETAKGTHEYHKPYAVFALGREMPHLVLEHDSLVHTSRYPASARVDFGAPFDDTFTAYAPEGYDQDAFQIFSPHVLAGLVDHGAGWDIEIIGRHMVVTGAQESDHTRPEYWQRLLDLEKTVAAPLARSLYLDRRPDGVADAPFSEALRVGAHIAPRGRRLAPSALRQFLWTLLVFLPLLLLFVFLLFS